jgi:hypothetical protein
MKIFSNKLQSSLVIWLEDEYVGRTGKRETEIKTGATRLGKLSHRGKKLRRSCGKTRQSWLSNNPLKKWKHLVDKTN